RLARTHAETSIGYTYPVCKALWHGWRGPLQLWHGRETVVSSAPMEEKAMTRKKKQRYPAGWDEQRVRKLAEHYDNQTEDEQVAEHEAAFRAEGQTVMVVPTELVPEIVKLISKKRPAMMMEPLHLSRPKPSSTSRAATLKLKTRGYRDLR